MKENKKSQIRKAEAILQIAIMIVATFAFAFLIAIPAETKIVEAVSADYCCEKTNVGAWCQNSPEANCNPGFRKTPTSCDATSFCKPGCCYDSSEGLCMENTPQLVCNNKNGTWADSAECEIPQCNLGCCVLDNQAALVTLTRCKKLSGFYGVKTNFINNIKDEMQCIAQTQLIDRGACVYEQEFTPLCKFTTRQECQGIIGTGNTTISKFYKDYLCSAEELGSVCGPTSKTMCIDGKDEVYFVDSCGNPANIYDASKVNDKSYWSKIIDKSESCGTGSANGNANSKTCGNCDYYSGSMCKKAERTNRANQGDYICKDLNCPASITSDGKDHRHGESWCSYDGNVGGGADSVGSRHFRHLCIAGEEIVEACEDYRKQICIGSERDTNSGKFSEAACRPNRWLGCVAQDEQEDCENTDKRDCFWVEGISFPKEITETITETKTTSAITGQAVFGGDDEDKDKGATQAGLQLGGGSCVPNVPPGLKFWDENIQECSVANTQCVVTFEKGLLDDEEEATDNKECLEESWAQKMNQVCASLGDCGGYVNWQGKYTDDGAEWKVDGKKKSIGEGIVNDIKKQAGVTGKAVGVEGKGINGLIIGFAKAGSFIIGGSLVSGTPPPVWIKGAGETPFGRWMNNLFGTGGSPPSSLPGASQTGGSVGVIAPGTVYTTELLKNPVSVSGLGEVNAVTQINGIYHPVGANGAIGPAWGTSLPAGAELLGTTARATTSTWTTQILGPQLANSAVGAIIETAAFALVAYGAGMMIGGMLGLDDEQTKTLATALAIGGTVWEGGIEFLKLASPTAFWWGIIAAAAYFIFFYKSTDTQIVTFTCQPWQAPVSGADCQKCNDNQNEPCSEYRCKSLGQACELLNPGTDEERCTWVNPKDVKSPGISPWEDVLTPGYNYKDVRIRPPGDGSEPGRMTIVRDGATDGCVKAFEPLEFGIRTVGPDGESEPAQCKIDYNHTSSFGNMSFYFGESNNYRYNHSQKLSLPSPASIVAAAPELKHDGTYTLYVRCQDKNGNENKDEFAIRFCVEKGPDTTAPKIVNTNIANNMPVKYNQTSLDLEVYVNEPANCKWSHEDRTYDNMENPMTCLNNVWEMNNELVYTCKTTLTGLKDHQENNFYFRCKDQPILGNSSDRNVNQQGYKYTVIGTQTLNIIDIKPNGTIYDSTDVVPVFLEVETANGYKNGEAICYYNTTSTGNQFIPFLYKPNEPTNLHKQRQDLPEDNYKYYIKCVDLGGNRDDATIEFKVDVDRDTPAIARAYKSNDLLKIVTTENSTCTYSNKDCNFNIEDGINMPYAEQEEHVAEWKTETSYYIRCKDRYGNQPVSNQCSMTIRPYDVLK